MDNSSISPTSGAGDKWNVGSRPRSTRRSPPPPDPSIVGKVHDISSAWRNRPCPTGKKSKAFKIGSRSDPERLLQSMDEKAQKLSEGTRGPWKPKEPKVRKK